MYNSKVIPDYCNQRLQSPLDFELFFSNPPQISSPNTYIHVQFKSDTIPEKLLISRIKRANQQSPLDFESFFFSNPPQIFQTHTRAFSARRERWRSRSIRWLETRGKARRTNWPTDRFGRGAWLPVTRASARWPDARDRGGGTTVTGPAGYRRSWMDAAPIVPRDNTPSVAVLMTMIAADRVERSARDGDRHAACIPRPTVTLEPGY